MVRPIRPLIDVYFDPNGSYGGPGTGCFRARLSDCYGCHGAGKTPGEAARSVVRTANSFYDLKDKEGNLEFAHLPKEIDGYNMVRLTSDMKPMAGEWDQDEPNQKRQVDDARQVAQIVAHIMTPRRW